MLIVLVCGGRDYGEPPSARIRRPAGVDWRAERNLVHATLDGLRRDPGIRALIHGAATGADACADEWARRNVDVPCSRYPADWSRYGKAAGPIRNAEMLAVLVAARPGGRRRDVARVRAIEPRGVDPDGARRVGGARRVRGTARCGPRAAVARLVKEIGLPTLTR